MGFPFTANIPTEEVYTLPHCREAEGTVAASLPLNYNGVLIDGFQLRFERGRVVNSSARVGDEVLKKLIATDEGSSRLGEVAIVPHSSPIAQSGILFYNTLYDENAASHFAFGQAYNTTLANGTSMTAEEFAEAGGNNSVIHVDYMVGCSEMNIDGITIDGQTEPVMRSGEWAFKP
jgi:aminopeptidase